MQKNNQTLKEKYFYFREHLKISKIRGELLHLLVELNSKIFFSYDLYHEKRYTDTYLFFYCELLITNFFKNNLAGCMIIITGIIGKKFNLIKGFRKSLKKKRNEISTLIKDTP